MADAEIEFSTIRMDIRTPNGNTLYFFVSKEFTAKWAPFWNDFHDFLFSLWSPDLPNEFDPALKRAEFRKELTYEEGERILEMMRSAPESERLTHKSLNRTLTWNAANPACRPIRITFFEKPYRVS